jgi:hypothetical protein
MISYRRMRHWFRCFKCCVARTLSPLFQDTELFLIGQLREARMGGTDRNRLARQFCLLVFSMHRLPLGTAYAIWTGIGATGSFW